MTRESSADGIHNDSCESGLVGLTFLGSSISTGTNLTDEAEGQFSTLASKTPYLGAY